MAKKAEGTRELFIDKNDIVLNSTFRPGITFGSAGEEAVLALSDFRLIQQPYRESTQYPVRLNPGEDSPYVTLSVVSSTMSLHTRSRGILCLKHPQLGMVSAISAPLKDGSFGIKQIVSAARNSWLELIDLTPQINDSEDTLMNPFSSHLLGFYLDNDIIGPFCLNLIGPDYSADAKYRHLKIRTRSLTQLTRAKTYDAASYWAVEFLQRYQLSCRSDSEIPFYQSPYYIENLN